MDQDFFDLSKEKGVVKMTLVNMAIDQAEVKDNVKDDITEGSEPAELDFEDVDETSEHDEDEDEDEDDEYTHNIFIEVILRLISQGNDLSLWIDGGKKRIFKMPENLGNGSVEDVFYDTLVMQSLAESNHVDLTSRVSVSRN